MIIELTIIGMLIVLFSLHAYSTEAFVVDPSSFRMSENDLRKRFNQPLKKTKMEKNGKTLTVNRASTQPLPVYSNFDGKLNSLAKTMPSYKESFVSMT